MTKQNTVVVPYETGADELQKLLDASPDVICSFDKEGRFIHVSAACQSVWGYTKEELLYTSLLEYVHPEDYVKTGVLADFVFGGNDLNDFENRWIHKSGTPIHMLWSAKWYHNKTLLCCVAKDDTLRKKKEEELMVSNERFKFVSMASSDVIWDRNFETGEIFFNSSAASVYGVLPQGNEAPDDFWREHLHPADRQRVIDSQLTAIKDPCCSTWREKYRFIKTDGSIIYASDRAVIIRNEKGRAIRMIAAVRDITEAKRLEETELLSAQRYRLLFQNSPFPKWIFDEETHRIVDVNKAAIGHYGYSREEFLQMEFTGLQPDYDRSKAIRIIKSLKDKKDKHFHGLVKHQKKSGQLIDVEITCDALFYDQRMHIVVAVNDVTQTIQAQKDIAKAIIDTQEKERSIIGKELHDNVNQLLTTAKLYVQNTVYYPEQKELFMEKSAGIIQKCIDEIRSLSKALITPTLSDLGFQSTIEEMVSSYKDLHLFSIKLNYELNEKKLDKDLKLSIYRLLQELLNNTVKYASASQISISIHERRNYMRVVYTDNGVGFETATISKGMGITNIKSRVAVHKGKIRIVSTKGTGCKALIIFPLE